VDEQPIGEDGREAGLTVLVGRRQFLSAVLGGVAGLPAWRVPGFPGPDARAALDTARVWGRTRIYGG
jgi:hypothetical protein